MRGITFLQGNVSFRHTFFHLLSTMQYILYDIMTSINPSLKLDYCQLFSTAKSQSIRFDQMDYLDLSHRMASTIPIEVLSTVR